MMNNKGTVKYNNFGIVRIINLKIIKNKANQFSKTALMIYKRDKT